MKTLSIPKLLTCISLIIGPFAFQVGAQTFDKDALKNRVLEKAKDKKNKSQNNAKNNNETTEEESGEKSKNSSNKVNTDTPKSDTNQKNDQNSAKPMSTPNVIEVVFSKDPFIGDQTANTTTKEFKALDEIYGRIKINKSVSEFLDGLQDELYKSDDGSYLVDFILTNKSNNEKTYVSKKIKVEDFSKPYINFDIAPAKTKSRDAYLSGFANGVANFRCEAFENREKIQLELVATFQGKGGSGTFVEIETIQGSFSVDFSNIEDSDDGKTKIIRWGEQIDQSAASNVVEENIKKMSKQANITFSSTPFSEGTVPKNLYTAGEHIYGRIKLNKKLMEYVKDGQNPTILQIEITCVNDNVYGIAVEKLLRSSEFNNDYIDFDIYPTSAEAKDVYRNNLGFCRTIYSQQLTTGKTLEFEISLATNYNMSYNGFKKIEAFGGFKIDYTGVNVAKLTELSNQGENALKAAENNANKLYAKESAEAVKSLPLPIAFTKGPNNGYTSYSNAAIITMIKTWYRVSEVYMLTFDKPEGTGDFSVWKDDYGYPTQKHGNHYFYFVFKDTDGYYKMAGGVLSLPHAGGGSYGDPIIIPYAPIFEGDPKFPYDSQRQKDGYEGVFFFDANKVKK